MLCVAQQIVARAVAKRVVSGTPHDALAALTRFVVLAFGRAIAAVIGIALNVHAAAVAEFLAADNTDIVGICAGAVHTAFVCAADITATTAVQIIILNVHTAVAAHHRIIRTGRIT